MTAARKTNKAKSATADLSGLIEALGHDFADVALLREALVHPSASSQRDKARDYDRLEFVGDRVLGVVIAEMLWRRFPQAQAGELAVRLNELVRQDSLAQAARAIGLGQYLVLSPGEAKAGGADKPAILADAFEAVIAALYLDSGMAAAARFVEAQFADRLTQKGSGRKDAKTELQEYAAAQGLSAPVYAVAAEEGPAHAPTFEVSVTVGKRAAQGRGGSKRAAEQAAASAWMAAIKPKKAKT